MGLWWVARVSTPHLLTPPAGNCNWRPDSPPPLLLLLLQVKLALYLFYLKYSFFLWRPDSPLPPLLLLEVKLLLSPFLLLVFLLVEINQELYINYVITFGGFERPHPPSM